MNNLSNFNIENLFSTNKSHPQFSGQLDIKSLFQTEDNNEINIDSSALLNTIHEKRNKLEKYYLKIFHKCWQTIESANKSGFTKIKYEIPKFSECIGYSCNECLFFLKKKLEEQKLDAKITGEISLYISWEMLENKINKERQEKEQKQNNFKSDFF
jgi:hypothetical protein